MAALSVFMISIQKKKETIDRVRLWRVEVLVASAGLQARNSFTCGLCGGNETSRVCPLREPRSTSTGVQQILGPHPVPPKLVVEPGVGPFSSLDWSPCLFQNSFIHIRDIQQPTRGKHAKYS